MISEDHPSFFCENSTLSTVSQDNVTPEEEYIQLFAKQMLQNRLFVGNFQEKRYVDSLQSYRDVIVVSNQETDLIRDLDIVRKRIRGYYNEKYWIGITEPNIIVAPAGYCLWVELPDVVFGNYWYKISKIKFRFNEILLRLRIIRSLSNTDTTTNVSEITKKDKEVNNCNINDVSIPNLNDSITIARDVFSTYTKLLFTNVLTFQNTIQAVKFTSVLLAALFTGAVQFLQYLGEFTLKFMREFSVLIKAVTPIIIAFINLIAKIIGGFYLLILSMWRGAPPNIYQSPYTDKKIMHNNRNPYKTYNTVYFKRSLPAPPRTYGGGVTITPLD